MTAFLCLIENLLITLVDFKKHKTMHKTFEKVCSRSEFVVVLGPALMSEEWIYNLVNIPNLFTYLTLL